MESFLRHKGRFPYDFKSYVSIPRNYVVVFLEDFSYHPDSGYQLLLDFYSLSDYFSFIQLFSEDEDSEWVNEIRNYAERPWMTFFRVQNYRTTDKLEKGKHYSLDIRGLKERQERYETDRTEGFPTLFRITLKGDQNSERFVNDPLLYYIGGLSYPQWVFSSLHSLYSIPQIPDDTNVELVVRDVDQGNFNEVRIDNKPYLVYDAGTDLMSNIRLFNSNILKLTSELDICDLPVFVISHWHTDHFSLLFALDDLYLQKLKYCIFPSYVNSLSVFSFIARLNLLGTKISMIVLPNQKVWTKMVLNNSLTLYVNKYVKSSTNNSGLSLFVKGPKNNALLPGDCRYKLAESQTNDSINTAMGPDQKHILVIPHHGGHAGKVSYRIKNGSVVEGIVSVGYNNRYGHPSPIVLSLLKSFIQSLKMTRDSGDIVEPL